MSALPGPAPVSSGAGGRRTAFLVVAVGIILVTGVAMGMMIYLSYRSGYGWGMMGSIVGWGWMWVAGAIIVSVLALFVFSLLYLAVSSGGSSNNSPGDGREAEAVARLRFARGEITATEYRQIREDLRIP